MLRRTPKPSALVGILAVLLICTIVWTTRGSKLGFSAVFLGISSLQSTDEKPDLVASSSQKVVVQAVPRVTVEETSTTLGDIQNGTLGFQKIFILSMPNRSDKRDALALSAYLSELEIEFIDGVDPSTMPRKAYPQNWQLEEPPGTLGCWRGHMDIYRRMVRDGIQSAMIMEDDVDWDVMIKAQMTEVARGTRYLQKAPLSAHSPYGDNWDLLVTGHCGVWNKVGEDQEYWVIKDDPTVIPPEMRTWWRKPNISPPPISGNNTRLVFSPYHFTCTGSYAISLSGAARALYDQAILPNARAIDMGLGGICKKHQYGFSTCLGTYPMITGIHHQAGNLAKDSDRKDINTSAERKVALSSFLVYPVRLNLGSLLRGETLVKAQDQKQALLKEIDILTLELPKGGPAFVKSSDYIEPEVKKDVPVVKEEPKKQP